jgi:hypothetical protein
MESALDHKITPIRSELTYRQQPHNYEAEQALLGAILVNNQVLDRVTEFLRPSISSTRSTAESSPPFKRWSNAARWLTQSP